MTAQPAQALLDELRAAGYDPQAEGGQLLLNAPNGIVPNDVANRVSKVRSKMLRLLGDPDEPFALDELLEDLAVEMEQGTQYEGYIRTGFHKLDKLMDGIAPGSVVVLAARPGMGKTAFALQIASLVADPNEYGSGPVMYCSYEMSGKAMARRLATQVTRTPRKQLDPSVYRQAKGRQLYFYDHDKSFGALVRRIRRFRIQHQNAKLVVVDQLGLMQPPGKDQRDRVAEVRQISRGLKALAMEERLPFLVLHQLGRQVDNRPDKKPTKSDLRDSGAVEEDADQILLMHRESYYHDSKRNDKTVEILLAKNRDEEDGQWVQFDWERPIIRYTERRDKPAKPEQLDFNGKGLVY